MRVLIVQNDETESLGLYEEILSEEGSDLQVHHPYDVSSDAPFPRVDDFDAFVIGPAPISANDVESQDFLRKEWSFLGEVVESRKPTRGDYEELDAEIAGRVGLPMAVENHFRFLVLLPQKGGSGLGAVNRYYGVTFNGELVCRGIELRRRDTPPYVKRVQREAIEALLSCFSGQEVSTRGVEKAQAVIEGACLRLGDGGVPEEELRISTALRRDPRDYKAKVPHVAAAEALEIAGKRMEVGSLVDYVYVDAGHDNPFRGVRPAGYGGGVDLEKYVDLVREAGRSVLVPFEAPVAGAEGDSGA